MVRAKDNPFRVERLHELPFFFSTSDSFARFYQRVQNADFRGAIVGPHGSGKTTLLAELMQELTRRKIEYRHLRLRDDGRTANTHRVQEWVSSAPSSAILILDGAGLLSWWTWRRLKKQSLQCRGLLVTAHRRIGRPTLISCQPEFSMLCELFRQLHPTEAQLEPYLEALFQKHRGNLRDCFRALYDEYAKSQLPSLDELKPD